MFDRLSRLISEVIPRAVRQCGELLNNPAYGRNDDDLANIISGDPAQETSIETTDEMAA